jgi:hypothetical protein
VFMQRPPVPPMTHRVIDPPVLNRCRRNDMSIGAGSWGRRVNIRCRAFCVTRSPSCLLSMRKAWRPTTCLRK